MKLMLDTNIIVDWLRNDFLPQAEVLHKKSLYISVITLAELYTGAYKSKRSVDNIKQINRLISAFKISIVDVSQATSSVYAKLRSHLELKGKRMDNFDLLIAATALEQKMPLYTRNKKHFVLIPNLELVNL